MKKIYILLTVLLSHQFAFSQNVGIGTTTPQSKLSIGSTSQFQVDSIGNIKKLNNLTTSFPSIQGANGQTLTNDGNGNLTWNYGLIPSGGIIMSTTNDSNIVKAGFTLIGMKNDSIQLPLTGLTSWNTVISTTNAPSARTSHTIIWTGIEYIIWGGNSAGNTIAFGDGFRYNPTTNIWTAISNTNAPSSRSTHTAVWTGTEMIIWGGLNSSNTQFNNGARYNPITNTWTSMTTTGSPSARIQHSAIWTGTEMIIWGGGGSGYKNDGGRYNPTTNTWSSNVTTIGAAAARAGHSAIWTGTEMIVWGGYNAGSFPYNDGKRFNPSTNTWGAVISSTNAPSVRAAHTGVWTGSEMIIWGGNSTTSYFNDGYRYNAATNTWITTMLPATNAPSIRANCFGAWSGNEMFVWGGNNASSTLDNGGRLQIGSSGFGANTAVTYFYFRKN